MMSAFSFRTVRGGGGGAKPAATKAHSTHATRRRSFNTSQPQPEHTPPDIATLSARYESEIAALKHQLSQSELATSESRSQTEQMAVALSAARETSNTLVHELTEARNEIVANLQQQSQLREQLEALQSELQLSQAELAASRDSLDKLLAIKSQRDRQVSSLLLERKKLQQSLEESKLQSQSIDDTSESDDHCDSRPSSANSDPSLTRLTMSSSAKRKSFAPRTPINGPRHHSRSSHSSIDSPHSSRANSGEFDVSSIRGDSGTAASQRFKKQIQLLEEKCSEFEKIITALNIDNRELQVRYKNATDARHRAEKKLAAAASAGENQENSNFAQTSRTTPKPAVDRAQRWAR